jgi:hypothetical protein
MRKSWMMPLNRTLVVHACLGELAGVGLALVARHVVLVDDDERLRESGELVEVARRGDAVISERLSCRAGRRPRTTPCPWR